MKLKTKVIIFASSVVLLLGAMMLSPSIAYALPYGNETLGPDGQLAASQPSYIPEDKILIPEGVSSFDRLSSPEDMFLY